MTSRNVPEIVGPDQTRGRMQPRAVVRDRAAQAADPEREQQREREDHARVPEREEEADADRPLALGHQLAGRVVDRADVVGVEGVAKAERVGGEAEADGEEAAAAEREVLRGDQREEQKAANRVQAADDEGHGADRAPLCGREPRADPAQSRRPAKPNRACLHTDSPPSRPGRGGGG